MAEASATNVISLTDSNISEFEIVEKVLKKAESAEFVNGIRKAILLSISMLWYSCDFLTSLSGRLTPAKTCQILLIH